MAEGKRFAFTKKRLEAIRAPATGRDVYHDDGCPNLTLVVSAASKTFYRYGRIAGRPSRLALGKFPTMGVEAARKACNRMTGAKAEGRDPAAERQAHRKEATLKDLFEHWLETYGKPRKRTWKEDERKFSKYMGDWHNRKLSAIRVPDVVAWLNKVGKDHGRYQANRCLELLTTLYTKAFEVGYVGPNPCKAVAAFPEESRERFLLPNEMKAFFGALAAQDEIWRDFFLLCLFTGARRGNVASMRWDEIDLPGGVWRIPASKTKNKRPGVVALSPPAVAVLESRRAATNNSEWVFPSDRIENHVKDPRKAWERVLAASGIKNLRMHDLRRSLGSWQAAMGVSLAIIGKSLGHADLKSTQVYSRLQLDPVKEAVSKASGAMLEAAHVEVNGNGLKLLEVKPATK